MPKLTRWLMVCLTLVALAVAALAADSYISITVSPNVLVIDAPTQYVHIHSNMPYRLVDTTSLAVTVDGDPLAPFAVFADSRGYMVIKIAQDLVEPLVAPGDATFFVTGATTAGSTFEGQDTIEVK